jgi:hypothetical protein
MKLIHGDAHDWSDDEVQRALRARYAAPHDESFWADLEQRTMRRINAEAVRGPISGQNRAAAAAILVAGVVSWRPDSPERIA